MISFLDLFKWDRFVATSFIELLFWLLAAIAVLFGVSGLIGGITLASVDPAGGLLAIAVSILGGFAGIVAARVVCEAVIMLFRVNENLMDIRDNLGAIERHAPPSAVVAPAVPELSFAEVLEVALAEPMPEVAPTGAGEGRRSEARSAEASSLEARLADIRARREGASAPSARAPDPAPAVSRQPAVSAGAKARLEEPAAPAWVAPPHVEPIEARSAAPDVRPATGPRIAEARQAESRKVEARKPVAKDETPAAERKPADPASGTPPVVEPRPAGAKSKDASPEDAKAVAEKLVDDASKVLAREAEVTADDTATGKSKAHDAA